MSLAKAWVKARLRFGDAEEEDGEGRGVGVARRSA